jgi:hypothetical protein
MKENTRARMLFGLAVNAGYRSDRNNPAAGKIKLTLDRVGISLDQDTIRNQLEELAKKPDLAKVEAEHWNAKES